MKLTHEEAATYIQRACADVVESRYTLRFGQALWNTLPKSLADIHHGTSNDFFYWKLDGEVLHTFFVHFVE